MIYPFNMELKLDLTLCVSEETKKEMVLGMYDWSQPREKLPEGMRLAKYEDLDYGTPFIFQRPSGKFYATKITSYGVDLDLIFAIEDKRVWVMDENTELYKKHNKTLNND